MLRIVRYIHFFGFRRCGTGVLTEKTGMGPVSNDEQNRTRGDFMNEIQQAIHHGKVAGRGESTAGIWMMAAPESVKPEPLGRGLGHICRDRFNGLLRETGNVLRLSVFRVDPSLAAMLISYILMVATALMRVSHCAADSANPPDPQIPITPIFFRSTKGC